jgi:hypothetical protein
MCDEKTAVNGGTNVDRSLPIISYAEVLLNYAEASNEMGNTASALDVFKQIRTRAGITAGTDKMYGLLVSPTVDKLRLIIQNERAIELAFEHHRFHDIRRWKIATPLLNGKYIHGMRISKIGNSYTYERINVRTRFFEPIYYYMPFPLKDIDINPLILNNPGY